MKRDLMKVYEFLQTKTNSRGLISIPQEQLASEMGIGAPKFHRLIHKLVDDGLLKIAGGGRQPKTIWVVPPDKVNKKD
jgi:DNA-binding Lrp family transcriptional regulator